MIAFGPKMEPGAIFHGPIDFGPPSGVMNKFQIVVDCKLVFYRVLIINTDATWLKAHHPDHAVVIDQKSHPFLEYDSTINCIQLHPVRVQVADQHIREKPKEIKGRISKSVRDAILKVASASKILTPEEKEAIKKCLGGI